MNRCLKNNTPVNTEVLWGGGVWELLASLESVLVIATFAREDRVVCVLLPDHLAL
jgi:hypothetical protein